MLMQVRRLWSLALMFWLIAGCIGEAYAKPKQTTFENMMKQSPTIAVAKLLEDPDRANGTTTLEISQLLKGTLKPGKHKVSFEDYPNVSKDTELVVFLDDKLVWRFVASTLGRKKSVDKAVLAVRGFYDTNAHFVTPGLVTLEQLKKYIKDGSLVYRFRGAIYFPQPGKTDWKAGSLSLSGSYDMTNKKVAVKGLPQLEGFPAQPEVNIQAESLSEEGKITLTYERNLQRQLEILGNVESLDGESGELLVQFAVTHPEVLTESAFKEYLGDAQKGGFFATFKLSCVPKQEKEEKRVLSLTLGKWTEKDWDSIQLAGWEKDSLTILAVTYHGPDQDYGAHNYVGESPFPKVVDEELARKDGILRMAAKTRSGDSVLLAFDMGGALQPKGPFTWVFQNEVRLALYTRRIRGTVLVSDGKTVRAIATFTPEFDSLGFNRINR
jgi:hypothetical protein